MHISTRHGSQEQAQSRSRRTPSSAGSAGSNVRMARLALVLIASAVTALGLGTIMASSASAATGSINGVVDKTIDPWTPDLSGLTGPVTLTIDPKLPAGFAFDGGTPGVKGTPGSPGTPDIPAVPEIPATADSPAVPGTPAIPGTPAVPGTPDIPAVPGTGTISGTPTAVLALTTFTITATDSATPANTATFTVDISVDAQVKVLADVKATVGKSVNGTTVFEPHGLTAPVHYTSSAAPTWLTFNDDGTVTGTPDAPFATATLAVDATDANGVVIHTSLNLEATYDFGSQSITGLMGSAVTATKDLTTFGPGTFEIESAFAKTGLSFDALTGVVSGKPAAPLAETSFAITQRDVVGGAVTGRGSVSVRIDGVLGASGLRMSGLAGTAITPYTPFASANAATAGLGATLTFSVSPALPDGLTLDPATGVISGIPSGFLASTTFTMTVTDATGARATGTFVASILGRPLPSTQELTTKVGLFVTSAPLTAQGWSAPVRYTITPALPTGLFLNPTRGTISGVAFATLATTVYDITATDTKGVTAHAALTLTIGKGTLAPPVISSVNGGTQEGSLTVSFSRPVLAPTGYTFTLAAYDAARQNLITSAVTTLTPGTISGLTPGTTYTVVVQAEETANFERVESLPKSGKATAAKLTAVVQPAAATVPVLGARVLIAQIGLMLADGTTAKNAKPLKVKGTATSRLAKSPRVRVAPSSFRRIVVPGVSLTGSLQVRIRVDGVWRFIGTVAPAKDKSVTLPVFSISRLGTYPIQLVPVSGRPVFVRLDVGPPKKAGRPV